MRLYNSNEIRAILKKSADYSTADNTDKQIGLTIEELRQLAIDAGIDPEQITKAAAELDHNSGNNEQNFWGGPFSYNSQALVEGEINTGQWEEMLLKIRNFFKANGEVTTRDSAFEWSSPWDSTNSAQVTAINTHGKTKISLNWNGPFTAIPYYIPVPFIGILSLFLSINVFELSSIWGISLTLASSVLAFLAGRWKLQKNLHTGFKKMRGLLGDLESIAGSTFSNSTNNNVSKENDASDVQGTIHLDEQEEEETMNEKSTRIQQKT